MAVRVLFILLFTFLLSCSGDEDKLELTTISNIIILDNGNEGTGADIEVNFSKQLSPQGISEYRVFLIPSNSAGTLDIATALELNEELYTSAEYSDVFPIQGIRLSSTSKSTDGAIISTGIAYDVAVLTMAEEDGDYNREEQEQ